MGEKHIFIINKNSVNAKDRIKYYREILAICSSTKIDGVIFETTNPEETKEILDKYTYNLEKYYVYAVGGDGTVNNVINSMDLKRGILQIHPLGTGNDLVRSLDFKGNLKTRILNANEQEIDLGTVNGVYFSNIASIGLDATAAYNVTKFKNWALLNGSLKYYLSILYTIASYKPIEISCEENPDDILKKTLVTVCNGKYYGGGKEISPNSNLEDGLFNIITAPELTKLQIIRLLLKVMNATHLKSTIGPVKEDKESYLHISSEQDLICNYDGEIMHANDFTFECLHKVLRIK